MKPGKTFIYDNLNFAICDMYVEIGALRLSNFIVASEELFHIKEEVKRSLSV